jgi:SAM-dependent methyltransferase
MVDERRPEGLDRRVPDWVRATFWGDHPDSLAPYVPSPLNIVREMLDLAGAGPGDIVYDLGCGDGRIIIMAARDFKAKGIGVDLVTRLIDEAKDYAESLGLGE